LWLGWRPSGLSYPITRFLEGYPLARLQNWRFLRHIPGVAVARQRRRYERLDRISKESDDPKKRALALWHLDQFFPRTAGALLPTRMGNAVRAFEQHSNVRWGLDGITIWPRVEALLSSEERELHVNAKVDMYVFANGAVGAFVAGVVLLIDKAANVPHPVWRWPLYAIPFVLSYLLYRAALGPVVKWGGVVRASIDLHRLELYEKLGIRSPTSFSDERQLAARLNQALLYGDPLLGDDLWRNDQTPPEAPAPKARRNSRFLKELFPIRRGGDP
jgi:hypothetical protein